jgi:hypothetical protein
VLTNQACRRKNSRDNITVALQTLKAVQPQETDWMGSRNGFQEPPISNKHPWRQLIRNTRNFHQLQESTFSFAKNTSLDSYETSRLMLSSHASNMVSTISHAHPHIACFLTSEIGNMRILFLFNSKREPHFMYIVGFRKGPTTNFE